MRISDWSSDVCSSDLWTAAQIARDTSRLSHNCVNWIDQQLDGRGYRPKAVDETIRQAIATFHPELVKKPETDKDDWDVRVNHDAGYAQGTSRLDAIGDSHDSDTFPHPNHQNARGPGGEKGSQ